MKKLKTYGLTDCIQCGKEFLKSASVSKLCSKDCRELRRVITQRANHIKNYKSPDYIQKFIDDPIGRIFYIAKYRAAKRGLEFSIVKEEIPIPTHCPVFGYELKFNLGKRTDSSYSLDRVDNSKGYVKDNVRVISWKANQYKGNLTVSEVEQLLKYMKGEI